MTNRDKLNQLIALDKPMYRNHFLGAPTLTPTGVEIIKLYYILKFEQL